MKQQRDLQVRLSHRDADGAPPETVHRSDGGLSLESIGWRAAKRAEAGTAAIAPTMKVANAWFTHSIIDQSTQLWLPSYIPFLVSVLHRSNSKRPLLVPNRLGRRACYREEYQGQPREGSEEQREVGQGATPSSTDDTPGTTLTMVPSPLP